jgi:hypothetical protein
MLTTAFSKAKVMDIVLPEPPKKDVPVEKQPQVDTTRALNIILAGDDKVYWYNGLPKANTVLHLTDFSDDGIRKVLLRRNKELFTKIETMNKDIVEGRLELPRDSITNRKNKFKRADKKGPVVLIKAGDNVKYKNVVDILDEMSITNIAVYALVDINDAEKKMVAAKEAAASGTAPQQ